MFRIVWVWTPAKEMLSLNCHLSGHCFQLGSEAQTRAPGLGGMGWFTPECDWNRGRDAGEEASNRPLYGGSSSSRHAGAFLRGAVASAPGPDWKSAGQEIFMSPWCWLQGNGCGKWR